MVELSDMFDSFVLMKTNVSKNGSTQVYTPI